LLLYFSVLDLSVTGRETPGECYNH